MSISLKEHLKIAPNDVSTLILNISKSAIKISEGFLIHSKMAGTKNVYGEEQLELDTWADKLILDELRKTELVKNFASEEQENLVEISNSKENWGIAIDPLDGVSCVATNLSVGTIVGMYKNGDVLEKGSSMEAALFVLYGPLTSIVYAVKSRGAHEFVLDKKSGEFILRKENLKIPNGVIFGSGGLTNKWTPKHTQFIKELEKQNYKVRFSGSLTADFNQVLNYGGLFCYPALTDKPEGKLRLLFEGNPLAFIAREAGGASTNGQQSVLEIKPKKIHQIIPLYLGGKKEIELAEKFFKK